MGQESTFLVTKLLPAALALIMFGLGLGLTRADFARIVKYPKAAVIGLAAQMFLLPAAALLLCYVFSLPPELAIGMMILAASPGGVTANIFSHLSNGDVALNLTLTAVNSVLAAVTLPLFVGFAIQYFGGDSQQIGFQFGKTLEVFAIVLAPVAIGMAVRGKFPTFASKLDKPFRIFSIVVLLALIGGAVSKEKQLLADHLGTLGGAVLSFNLLSLAVGYGLPLLFKIPRAQAIAIAMEIGIHNGTLAMTIAFSVLQNTTYGMPAAIYSVLMFLTAGLFSFFLKLQGVKPRAPAQARIG